MTNTITVYAAGNQYQGDPEFTISVDGVQVGGPYSVSQLYSANSYQFQAFTLTGNFALTPSSVVSINYINDLGGSGGDRNLYVNSVVVNGRTFLGSVAALGTNGCETDCGALWGNGSLKFNMAEPAPNPTGGLSLVGVNTSGAEWLNGPTTANTLGSNYSYPTNSELAYYASKGLNVIRLPLQWERVQRTLNGPLSSGDMSAIDKVVSYANSLGIKVILDLHNYGSYNGQPIGSASVPVSAFDNFWSQMAAHYAGNSGVMFGLMNEPTINANTWMNAANSAIAAIRATGATSQKILVSGADWDVSSRWLVDGNATVANGIVDPSHNMAFEVHEYPDSDGSGVGGDTVSANIGVERINAVTEWARENGKQLFLGEFGSNTDSLALTNLNNTLAYMKANSDVWLGSTEWEASTAYNYYFNVAPVNGQDSPQMKVLDQYAPGASVQPGGPTLPVITGLAASTAATDGNAVMPFKGATVTDTSASASDSATITLTNASGVATDANGVLSGAGLTHTGVGTYALATVSPATLGSELAALSFLPTVDQTNVVGSSIATNFKVAVANGNGSASASTTVSATETVTKIAVSLSEDAYQGDAQCYVTVDGVRQGGLQTITASHAAGASQTLTYAGQFGTGPQKVAVQFTNDAYGGSSSTDRNLYVNSIAVNGSTMSGSSAALYSNSTATFTLAVPGTNTTGSVTIG
jgi:aryl-phospho-beta-D-glucosidase BglC (GH1 family)